MKNYFISASLLAAIIMTAVGCKKDAATNTTTNSDAALETKVLTDFANKLVNPDYQDIQANAKVMLTAVNTFIATSKRRLAESR